MGQEQNAFHKTFSRQQVSGLKESAKSLAENHNHQEGLKTILGLLDLTSLNTTDNITSIGSLCTKVNRFPEHFPGLPNVAAICVYPNFVETVKDLLTVSDVKIASVAGGFPSSQTYFQIKRSEIGIALDKGADEIDIVFPLGLFIENDIDAVLNELREMKEMMGEKHLKVILETGAYSSYNDIYRASMLAMHAGADFIKTSTGKQQPAATLEAVGIMCTAINDYYHASGKKVGIKPAGGISTTQDALPYYSMVFEVLGPDWLKPALFRIGASRLANDLLAHIQYHVTGSREEIGYF